MRYSLVRALCLALALGAAAAQCPSVLELVEGLPDSSAFSEIIAALSLQDAPLGTARRRLQATQQVERPFRACPRIYSPVCSVDGRQFGNDCLAGSHGAEVACRGPCPCGAASASGGPGPVDPTMGPCPRVYAPVCGVDGVTYQSRCLAGGAQRVACEGRCPCGQAERGGRELLQADGLCPTIYAPVCGANNRTYSNECAAGSVEVACAGECPCAFGGGGGGGSVDGVGGGGGDGVACYDILQPVCGTDGTTYPNDCYAAAAGAGVACNGRCPCRGLLEALQERGGLLLVPTDDALLAAAEALANATGLTEAELLADKELLQPLLARHVVLADASQGTGPPVATPGGTPVRTEGGQALQLFADEAGAPESVAVGRAGGERVPVLASVRRPSCPLAAYLIPQVLEGPSPQAGS